MGKKQTSWKTRGMNQDMSVSAFNPEFAFENINLRLATNEHNTTMSWVNERGTEQIFMIQHTGEETWEYVGFKGVVVGTAVINGKLIVFTHGINDTDYIYKLYFIPSPTGTGLFMEQEVLFEGNLKLSTEHPLETLVSYESDLVQKVYWTDGINQPRVINVAAKEQKKIGNTYIDTQFDFVPTLQLKEEVSVQKLFESSGMFAPGVIQYCFTYYNKHGQESNIFHTTPLLYISHRDRGASPEDKVANSFKITVKDVDTTFDYLRIYSVQRTSLDATPIVRRVQDIPTSVATKDGEIYSITFTDTGASGDSVDPTELLYKGGEVISAGTMTQKDNTLFLGDIRIKRQEVVEDYKELITGQGNNRFISDSKNRQIVPLEVNPFKFEGNPLAVNPNNYVYYSQLTATDANGTKMVPCGGFKRGDFYRLGVQFQHESGRWSDPVFLDDHQVLSKPSETTPTDQNPDETYKINLPIIEGYIKVGEYNGNRAEAADAYKDMLAAGYKKVRPVVVFPSIQDREVLCQGVTAPTVYTNIQRLTDKSLYAQSSWFFRPFWLLHDGGEDTWKNYEGCPRPDQMLGIGQTPLEYTNYGDLTGDKAYDPKLIKWAEIQGDFVRLDGNGQVKEDARFYIDDKFRTFHSPDVEFDEQMYSLDFADTFPCYVGQAEFKTTFSDIDIQTETPTAKSSSGGFIHKSFIKGKQAGIIAGLFYEDYTINDIEEGGEKKLQPDNEELLPSYWMVYPWQADGSLNNDINRPQDKGVQTAKLKKKIISNLRFADTTFEDGVSNKEYSDSMYPRLWSSEEATIVKFGSNVYAGNIDTMLIPETMDSLYLAFPRVYQGQDTYWRDEYAWEVQSFDSDVIFRTYSKNFDENKDEGIYQWDETGSEKWYKRVWDRPGEDYVDLVLKKSPIRMKYKSTPHLAFELNDYLNHRPSEEEPGALIEEPDYTLAVFEIKRNVGPNRDVRKDTRFGGNTDDALKANVWVPCGEATDLLPVDGGGFIDGTTQFTEDPNAYMKIEYLYGDTYYQRYDCLKTYAFTREDVNQIVEIGSFMLEGRVNIDGRYDRNRGQVSNLNMSPINFNLMNPVYSQKDNFFSYRIQDEDFYNNDTYPNQVTWTLTKENGAETDAWTHITLANILELDGDKGKVTALRRMDNSIISFQDTGISQILYNENAQISTAQGVPIELANSGKVDGRRYLSDSIGCSNKWSIAPTPTGLYFMDSVGKGIYRFNGQLENISLTGGMNTWAKANIPSPDKVWNPDVFTDSTKADNFISHYDKSNHEVLFVSRDKALAFSERMNAFTSFYNYGGGAFLENVEDSMVWIAPTPWLNATTLWKHQGAGDSSHCHLFGRRYGYGTTFICNAEPQADKTFTNLEFRSCVDGDGVLEGEKFEPFLPFDSLEVWNEYQHGITTLHSNQKPEPHFQDVSNSLARKFRIWRCDIPRNNADLSTDEGLPNCYRKIRKPVDRMRNPWLYLRLMKGVAENMPRAEVHDIVATYFS